MIEYMHIENIVLLNFTMIGNIFIQQHYILCTHILYHEHFQFIESFTIKNKALKTILVFITCEGLLILTHYFHTF